MHSCRFPVDVATQVHTYGHHPVLKKTISLIFVFLVTALALTYALWDVDFGELGQLLSGGDYRVLFPLLVLLVLFYWMKALRWVYILKPVEDFTVSDVTPSMVIGFAGNNVLPAHLGELIRIVIFARKFSKPISSITITLLVERIFDLLAILSLYAIGMAIIGTPPESLEIGAWLITLLVAGFFLAITTVLYKPGLVHAAGDWLGTRLPASIGKQLTGIIHNVLTAFSSLRSPASIAGITIWSIINWMLMAGMIWLSLFAYGANISPAVTLILMAVLALAAAIPNAPGYIGAIQAAYVFALTPFGISEEVAFAASVLYLVCQWLPVTIVGAILFIAGGFHVAEVRMEVEEAGEQGPTT